MKFVNKRPYDSAILIMGSGALILAVGIIALKGYFGVGDQSAFDLYLILAGTLAGSGLVLTGALSIVLPDWHRALGASAMLLSLLSFAGTSGGLYIGAIGGLLGGIMAISWKKKEEVKDGKRESTQNHA